MLSPYVEAVIAGVEVACVEPVEVPARVDPVPALVPGSFTAAVLYRLWQGVMVNVMIPPVWIEAEPNLLGDIAAQLVHRTGCREIRSASSADSQRKLLNEFTDSRFEFEPDGTMLIFPHRASKGSGAVLIISEEGQESDDELLDPQGWWRITYHGGPRGDLPLDVVLSVGA